MQIENIYHGMSALYMDTSCLASVAMIRTKTRMYIRFFSGYANYQGTA